jgi:hypothetical protein
MAEVVDLSYWTERYAKKTTFEIIDQKGLKSSE